MAQLTSLPRLIRHPFLIGTEKEVPNPKGQTDMTRFIPTFAKGNLLAAVAAVAFVFCGAAAEAQTQSPDATGLFAGQIWSIETNRGMTIIAYGADGTCFGIETAPRRKDITFDCQYQARPAAGQRVVLTIRSELDGYRAARNSTLRLMPDGNLYNETARAVAYWVDPAILED